MRMQTHILRGMPLLRVKANWTGFSGAPGLSVMHFNAFSDSDVAEATDAAESMQGFFNGCGIWLPTGCKVQVDSGVEVIDEATGQLQSIITVPSQSAITGSGTGSYAAPVGAVVNWHTADVRNGRRVRGRTFLVPLSSQAMDVDGTLKSSAHTTFTTLGSDIIARSPSLQVYSRPTAPGAADGLASLVTSSRVPDKAAVLRARRD